MADPTWGQADARDALAIAFTNLLDNEVEAGVDARALAVRLADGALSLGWQPSEWTRAVGRLSMAFGETGAPWASTCEMGCLHDTCTAMHGLVEFFRPDGWLPADVQRGGRRG